MKKKQTNKQTNDNNPLFPHQKKKIKKKKPDQPKLEPRLPAYKVIF